MKITVVYCTHVNRSISYESFGTKEREKARCAESEACDQTVTLRYRVSLEGFVNVT